MLRLESFLGQFWKVVILFQKSNFTGFWYTRILHWYRFYIFTNFKLEPILGYYQL
jgi:hypothetical protein